MVRAQILDPNDFQVTSWSGGLSTQLYLFPENGSYANRQFSYRLSTASIECQTSRFTDLTGYHRLLMTLDEPIFLEKQTGAHLDTISLSPFQVYAFEGHESIKSHGICRDFNLIYDDSYQGNMKPIHSAQHTSHLAERQLIYALTDVTIHVSHHTFPLKAQQLLVLNKEEQEKELTISYIHPLSKEDYVAIWAGLKQI